MSSQRMASRVPTWLLALCVSAFGCGLCAARAADGGGCAAGGPLAPGLVGTTGGPVLGVQRGQSYAFLGIPYAAPPVGSLRFRAPQDPACSSELREASTFGPMCPQLDDSSQPVGDEDCLTLNLWTPASAPQASLPVMVYLHGGGNMEGGSAARLADGSYLYDGQDLSEKGQVVMVTINYRLGILGYLALPELETESEHQVSGNYGILDQIAALRWVQRNIAAFGGDPARVTLFGQSAGGYDVCQLLTSPLAAGLFSRAIIQSAACNQQSTQQAEAIGAEVVTAVGCEDAADTLACLRAKTASELVAARPGSTNPGLVPGDYQPHTDGYVFPVAPLERVRQGLHAHVPLIVGANSHETDQWVPEGIDSEAQYQQFIRGLYPEVADSIFHVYPVSDYASPRDAAVAVTTDARFICPTREIARAVSQHQSEPVFRYLFDHTLQLADGLKFRGIHSQELLFVFDHLAQARYVPTAAEQALADAMVGYWSGLAAAGDLGEAGLPAWPQYHANQDPYLVLDTLIRAGAGLRSVQCDFWDSIDRTPPDTALVSTPPGISNSPAAHFAFSATEDGSTFECQLDGSGFSPCMNPHDYSALPDGLHTFQVRAVDPAGNADPSPAGYGWNVDTTPADTVLTAMPRAASRSAAATFVFISTEAGSVFECELDGGGFAACGVPMAYSALSQGQHQFRVRATDPAGNPDPSPASCTWTVDTLAPETTLTATPPLASRSKAASFAFSATEAESTFECSLDTGAFAACTSPKAYTGLSEGFHTVRVRALDPAGNPDATPASHTWKTDTTPPDTSLTYAPPAASKSTTAQFAFSGTEAGGSFECRLDAASFGACTPPKAYGALPQGVHTFQVRALDPAGNPDPSPASHTWTVDTTVPVVSALAVTLGPAGTATIQWLTNEAASSRVDYVTGSGAPATLTDPALVTSHVLSLRGLTAGVTYWYRVTSVDQAGNVTTYPAPPNPAARFQCGKGGC